MRPLLLALTVGLFACSEYGPPAAARSGSVLLESVAGSLHAGQPDVDAVKAQAVLDLRCATGVVVRSETEGIHHSSTSGAPFHVWGCGQVITYVAVSAQGHSTGLPGYVGEKLWITIRRFVPVSREGADAALAALERDASSIGLPHQSVDRRVLDPWLAFSEAAARQLACPGQSLVIDIVEHIKAPSTYLAEGCGYRGLFVKNGAGALVLTSRVALTPGEAR